MDIHVTNDQIGRYFRRIQLGLRFLAHGARTRTTCSWTGLTPDQLATLRRRWMFDGDDRLRGPSPSSCEVFFRSDRVRNEATLLACMSEICGGASAVPGIETGERLCEAFEAFREWEPDSAFDFEQLILLIRGLHQKERIDLLRCRDCSVSQLIDKLGNTSAACRRCQTHPATRARGSEREPASKSRPTG
jgi:hypothetical protein